MTSSNGNIFRVTGHLCGEFTGDRWIPRTKASDAELSFFLDLRLNTRLSKQFNFIYVLGQTEHQQGVNLQNLEQQ